VLIVLLLATLLVALAVSTLAALIFLRPARRILRSILPQELSSAWVRFLVFALYVVGVAGGVRIHQIERYLDPNGAAGTTLTLNRDRWIIEIYSTGIGALASIAWMLLVFFVFALIAFVVMRALEGRGRTLGRPETGEAE
jgi:hypothetical protein